ncbi:MAG: flagellar filament capping protein FliD [Bacillota bacterium]
MSNNGLGIAGLITGMDTQATIDKIMKYSKMPLDRLKQQQQSLIWKQEAYRSQNAALAKLKDMVFNLKLQNTYNTKTVTSSNSQVVTATAAANAVNGNYNITVSKLATYATNSSANNITLRSRVEGTALTSVTIDATHNSFVMTVDGVQKTIDLSAYNGTTYTAGGSPDLTDLADKIQTQLNVNFGAEAVLVKVTSANQLVFYTNDGKLHNITVNDAAANSLLSGIGFTNGAVSDPTALNLTSSLWNQREYFKNSSYFAGKSAGDVFKFSINGQSFSFTYNNTMNDIINAINSNSAAGVTAAYDSFNDKIVLTATKPGDYNNGNPGIIITDDPANNTLSSLFNIVQNTSTGQNAEFTINGLSMTQLGNSFTYNNITFNLTGITAGTSVVVNVATDISAIVTKITDFVNKYNEVIAGMNEKVTEDRATSGRYQYYEPLTDEQKKEMTADQIKAWEDKAKQGLLHNDELLRSALDEMRMGINRTVIIPQTISGNSISKNLNLTQNNNQFTISLGTETKQIILDPLSYDLSDSAQSKLFLDDLQRKLNLAFGPNRIKAAITTINDNKQISLTTQNASMTLTSGAQNDGLAQLGFSAGQSVKVNYTQLSQIGITTGSYTDNGKLYLDTEKLKAALANDPDGVMRLLAYNETPVSTDPNNPDKPTAADIALAKSHSGIFSCFYDILNAYSGPSGKFTKKAGTTSTSSIDNSELGQELIKKSAEITKKQDQIDAEEDRLWKQFNMMETMIAQMNNQLAALNSILGIKS